MRTYPVKLGHADGMPTSLFDPRWREPDVAARVAFVLFCRNDLGAVDGGPLVDPPGAARAELVDARVFELKHVHDVDKAMGARRFKGGSFGELHRRYAFGTYTVNFHAQAVAFGFDDAGRYFVNATVGRFDGPWGNDAILAVTYRAKGDLVGAALWQADLDPVGDQRVRLLGKDARLAQRFADVDSALVSFTARHGKDVPQKIKDETQPKLPGRLSRARRSVVVKELAKAVAAKDTDGIRRLLAGVAPDEIEGLVKEAKGDVAGVLAMLKGPAS